jgi:RNA polymerase sigma-70 factor (ECF subfamily)
VADEDEDATLRLLERARAGDKTSLDELFERHLRLLERWATGRLPRWARGNVDTSDLLQETMLETFKRLDAFEPRGKGALQAYLRQAFVNRLRNQLRRVIGRPAPQELDSRIPDEATSPLEAAIRGETLERYEAGLDRLEQDERSAIVMRIELGGAGDPLAHVAWRVGDWRLGARPRSGRIRREHRDDCHVMCARHIRSRIARDAH